MEQLINEIAVEVSERLMFTVEDQLQARLASTPKQEKLLLDSNELAEQLSVSVSTIVKLRKQGMPIIRIGDAVRFDPKAVMQFITKQNFKDYEKFE